MGFHMNHSCVFLRLDLAMPTPKLVLLGLLQMGFHMNHSCVFLRLDLAMPTPELVLLGLLGMRFYTSCFRVMLLLLAPPITRTKSSLPIY